MEQQLKVTRRLLSETQVRAGDAIFFFFFFSSCRDFHASPSPRDTGESRRSFLPYFFLRQPHARAHTHTLSLSLSLTHTHTRTHAHTHTHTRPGEARGRREHHRRCPVSAGCVWARVWIYRPSIPAIASPQNPKPPKETYYGGKRGGLGYMYEEVDTCNPKPPKETYYGGKRNLLWRQKKPPPTPKTPNSEIDWKRRREC